MKYDPQIEAVRRLSVVPSHYQHDDAEVTEFKVDQVVSTSPLSAGKVLALIVSRSYTRPGLSFSYNESYQVGPRGATKLIFHAIY